jgi:hypothetical protein
MAHRPTVAGKEGAALGGGLITGVAALVHPSQKFVLRGVRSRATPSQVTHAHAHMQHNTNTQHNTTRHYATQLRSLSRNTLRVATTLLPLATRLLARCVQSHSAPKWYRCTTEQAPDIGIPSVDYPWWWLMGLLQGGGVLAHLRRHTRGHTRGPTLGPTHKAVSVFACALVSLTAAADGRFRYRHVITPTCCVTASPPVVLC